jgi:hypothetical protein
VTGPSGTSGVTIASSAGIDARDGARGPIRNVPHAMCRVRFILERR